MTDADRIELLYVYREVARLRLPPDETLGEHPGCVHCMAAGTTVRPGQVCPECGDRRPTKREMQADELEAKLATLRNNFSIQTEVGAGLLRQVEELQDKFSAAEARIREMTEIGVEIQNERLAEYERAGAELPEENICELERAYLDAYARQPSGTTRDGRPYGAMTKHRAGLVAVSKICRAVAAALKVENEAIVERMGNMSDDATAELRTAYERAEQTESELKAADNVLRTYSAPATMPHHDKVFWLGQQLEKAEADRDGHSANYLSELDKRVRAEAALATARQEERERLAQLADAYPDTLESVGEPGSGKFKAVSKLARMFRDITDKKEGK